MDILYRRQVPVRHEVDVCVAGGGPAGVAAAVAAARGGARVFLAEAMHSFGGLGTGGLVPAFMRFGDGINFLAAGLGKEVLYQLEAEGGTTPNPVPDNGSWGVGIHAEALKRVYDRLVADAGVDFAFGTRLIDVEVESGQVVAAIFAAKSGLFAVRAHTFVDATGDGDLCAWAGAPFELGNEAGRTMPGTLCSLWTGVDWERPGMDNLRWRQNAQMEKAQQDGVFSMQDSSVGMGPVAPGLSGGNIGHVYGVDGSDERSITRHLLEGRQALLEWQRYYRDYLGEGFAGATLALSAALLGIRESRRILGDYLLNLEDFKTRAVFPDEIGRFSYPVDIHPMNPDPASLAKFKQEWDTYSFKDGESYGVPYRCLIPQTLANVLVAGRCLSADRFLQSSIRVMPGCFLTGQAAGAAAGLAARQTNGQTRTVNLGDLQAALLALGAYLPNA